jgi:hypothetical protein
MRPKKNRRPKSSGGPAIVSTRSTGSSSFSVLMGVRNEAFGSNLELIFRYTLATPSRNSATRFCAATSKALVSHAGVVFREQNGPSSLVGITGLVMEHTQDYYQGGEENDDGEQNALARSVI